MQGMRTLSDTDTDILDALLASLPDEVLVYDRSDRLVRWNQAFETAFSEDSGCAPARGLRLAEIFRARLAGLGVLSPDEIEQEVRKRISFTDRSEDRYEIAAVGRDAVLNEFRCGDFTVFRVQDACQPEQE